MAQQSLYWFTQDLRIQDNQALLAAQASQSLICVYIIDPRWFKAQRWQHTPLGMHRWIFLQECLSDLAESLRGLGQRLHTFYGQPEDIIPKLCHTYDINHLLCTRLVGSDEKAILDTIRVRAPQTCIEQYDQYTLFSLSELPIRLKDWPKQYTPFRKLAEAWPVADALPAPETLPAMPKLFALPAIERPDWVPAPRHTRCNFYGGERAAQGQLDHYFSGQLPQHYKEVRNALEGWDNSSKFSPWLNQGCLSPRQITSRLRQYEHDQAANDSTHWLYLELLWREYFQWLHHRIGSRLFLFKGLAKTAPLTSYYAERFQKWCDGQTPYALVNACAKELKQTGYVSNRGRQILASCLVNELSVDWRYGAAWFEHQLVDYDVAVNWGNWQYIAGVGVDPRGGRHFDIEKQTSLYDSEGHYRRFWGAQAHAQLDSVDAADWPIVPGAHGD